MKCSRCGKTFKDIKAIGAHYRKSHPGVMKAKKPRKVNQAASLDEAYRAARDMIHMHELQYHGK